MNPTDPRQYVSLFVPLVEAAARAPERLALTFVAEDGSATPLTMAALDREARLWMEALRAEGIGPGDIVILVMGHSRELIATFLGALYLGAVPSIYAYPSEKLDVEVYAERVRAAVAGAGARAVITTPALATPMQALLAVAGCRLLGTDALAVRAGAAASAAPAPRAPEAPAFLQFTSGTTGLPRAVVHTHARVLRYIAARAKNDRFQPDDVIVSWLPLYHDLGLVSGLLTPLVVWLPTVLISPMHWVRDPRVLPLAIHRFRGTRVWMPNFALNHCATHVRPRDLEGVDLSHWRALVLGGEPVRPASLRVFVERFGPYGFREQALMAGYGMAETVEGSTATVQGEPPRIDWVRLRELHEEQRAVPAAPEAPGAAPIVSCGFPLEGVEVAIVDVEGRQLAERCVGEITLRSSYMLEEYHRRPEDTARVVRDGWLRSGDLGYLAEGQLYVCGRMKDLIIVGGRNVYPQDLESIADTVPGLRPGRSVAFGVEDARLGSERVVLVCETVPGLGDGERLSIERELRRRVVQELDVVLGDLRFVESGWVIKTSSGKVARAANRERYLTGRAVAAAD